MIAAKLVAGTDPILWRRAQPVNAISTRVRRAFDQMAELMQGLQGIGIAAPQIGLRFRCCIVDDIDGERVRMINPRIAWCGPAVESFREGCLSFPGAFVAVQRHRSVAVEYLDLDGNEHQRGFHGVPAACAQHEIDHLDGIVFFARAYQQGMQ